MAEFFRRTTLWVVDYLFDGRPRRWYRAVPLGVDPADQVAAELVDLHGARAMLKEVRPATPEEELAYLRGEVPVNRYCPVAKP